MPPHRTSHACSLADRKSTRLNSSHSQSSYAVFCLKKKTTISVVIVRRRLNASIDRRPRQHVPWLSVRGAPGEAHPCIWYRLFHNSHSHFFFTHPAPTQIYTLSLHDALPI